MMTEPVSMRAALLFLALAVAAPLAKADCLGMQVHAHRGAKGAPENSLEALRNGYAGEFDGIETDLQTLRDQTWAVHHDMTVGRVVRAGANRPLSQMSAQEWQAARMVSANGGISDVAPPFLDDAIALARLYPDKTFNAEIKQVSGSCAPVQALVGQLRSDMGHGNWFLTAVDARALRCARSADADGYLGLVVLDPRNASHAVSSARVERLASRYARAPVLNRQWLGDLQRDVRAPVGVHVDIATLQANPGLLQDAASLQMPVFTYSMAGDEEHADVLAFYAKRSGRLPSGAIIDGSPAAFCGKLKRQL